MDILKEWFEKNPWAVVAIAFIIAATLVACEYIDVVARK